MQCGGLAQLEERVVCNDEAPGSKPGFSIQASVHFWPSGLRRYVQVVVSSDAWVRIPQSAVLVPVA